MSITKTIVFTVIVNFVVCGFFHETAADDINISQYEGVWYAMAFIGPKVNKSDVYECFWLNVTTMNTTSQRFKQDTRVMINGDLVTFTGLGKIYNHQIRISTLEVTWVLTVTKRVNGTELIIHDEIYPHNYELLSRSPSVSAQTMTEFDNIAAEIGVTATRINHSGCSYNSMD